jgi:hypothetical protein
MDIKTIGCSGVPGILLEVYTNKVKYELASKMKPGIARLRYIIISPTNDVHPQLSQFPAG